MDAQQTVQAIYKNGLLYPRQKLSLAENEPVELSIIKIQGESENAAVISNEHPYIIQTPEICGGSPTIRGTRIPVKVLVGYYQMGQTVDEIIEGYPHLTRAQFFDALSYYYDHQDEIDDDRTANELDNLLQKFNLEISSDGVMTPKGEL